VGAQIHGATDDITVFRLEDSKLWVTKGNITHHAPALPGPYQLGTRLNLEFVVWQNTVQASCNGTLITTIPGKFSGAYYKTGAYTQINAGVSPASAANYGETVVYAVTVQHLAGPPVPDPAPADPPAPVPGPPVSDLPPPPPGALDWWRTLIERFGGG
jgi:hypothetical protein